jgi:hypothetical protein
MFLSQYVKRAHDFENFVYIPELSADRLTPKACNLFELAGILCQKPNNPNDIRVIRKVRGTQHQNPEFGHTQGEIQKKPAERYISIQRGMKLRNPSILVLN